MSVMHCVSRASGSVCKASPLLCSGSVCIVSRSDGQESDSSSDLHPTEAGREGERREKEEDSA